MSLASHPIAQRSGKALGHFGQRLLACVLGVVLPTPPNVPIEDVPEARRILIVRPNFRIGNTLLATPLIIGLRKRFPRAQLDYLAGDTTAALLAHLPIDTVYTVSRRFLIRPWQFVALFVRLRRMHYDVALEGGMNSFSGGLYTYLTGAHYRIGCSGKADRFLNVRVPLEGTAHAYSSRPAIARWLGPGCPDHPVYAVSAEEHAAALTVLAQLQLTGGSAVLPFVGVFVGGHLKKRWPSACWIELVRTLAGACHRIVVFLGPEELPFENDYRRELPADVRVLRPQPLRLFAALLGAAHLVVTPDSGPMHLAAALGVPTIALLQSDTSRRYAPHSEQDRVLVRPSVAEAVAAVDAHPSWPDTLPAVS